MASPASLKIMISGAPASGKGTQCELISKQYGVVHVSVGDLLRAEVEAQTENGKHALNQMEKGMLVSDEIVIKVKNYVCRFFLLCVFFDYIKKLSN